MFLLTTTTYANDSMVTISKSSIFLFLFFISGILTSFNSVINLFYSADIAIKLSFAFPLIKSESSLFILLEVAGSLPLLLFEESCLTRC